MFCWSREHLAPHTSAQRRGGAMAPAHYNSRRAAGCPPSRAASPGTQAPSGPLRLLPGRAGTATGIGRLVPARLGSPRLGFCRPLPLHFPPFLSRPARCRHVVGRGRQLRAQGRRGGEGAEAAAEALLCLPRHQEGEGCLVSALPGPWGFPSGSPGCAGGVGASRHGCEEGGAGLVARPKGRFPEEVLKLLKLLHSC